MFTKFHKKCGFTLFSQLKSVNILPGSGMNPKYLLGYGMGPIFYRDGGMDPPGTDPLIYIMCLINIVML